MNLYDTEHNKYQGIVSDNIEYHAKRLPNTIQEFKTIYYKVVLVYIVKGRLHQAWKFNL